MTDVRHYPLLMRLDEIDRYFVWSTHLEGDEPDTILLDKDGDLLSFSNLSEVIRFAQAHEFEVVAGEQPKAHDIDAACEWAVDPSSESEACTNALDVWNLFGDVVATIPNRTHELAVLVEHSPRVYEMLFLWQQPPLDHTSRRTLYAPMDGRGSD